MMKFTNISINRHLTLFVIGLVSFGLTAPVFAQDQEDQQPGMIEEVIVTAQKREQNLQDVPVAVSMISGETIMKSGLTDAKELQLYVPSLTYSDGNVARGTGFLIRGVGTRSFDQGVEASVLNVVDGVVNGIAAQALVDLIDVERVEVLRGPQGFLFGKNASAGVVNVITRAPTEETEVLASLSYGSLNELKASVSVAGGLGDITKGRLTAYSNNRDGYITNVHNGNDLNDVNEWGLRGKLDFEITDNVVLKTIAAYSKRDANCCYWVPRIAIGDSFINMIYPVVASETNDEVNLSRSTAIVNDMTNKSLSAEFNVDLGAMEFISITAYTGWDSYNNTDADSRPEDLVDWNGGDFEQSQFTQEFRLANISDGGIDWLVGLWYSDQDIDGEQFFGSDTTLWRDLDLPWYPLDPSVNNYGSLTVFNITNKNTAAFANVSFPLGEKWVLTTGIRYSKKDADGWSYRELWEGYDRTAPFFDAYPKRETSVKDTNWSGKIALQYDISDTIMMYGSWSRGYKGPALTYDQEVDAEIPESWELGLRSTWLDRALVMNITAFHTIYSNFQVQNFAEDDSGQNRFFFGNADEMLTKGIEFDLMAAPTDNFRLTAGLAYIDSYFSDFPNAACWRSQPVSQGCVGGVQDLTGKPVPHSPKWTASLIADYNWHTSSSWDWFVRGSYYYRGKTTSDIDNDPNVDIGAYGLVDASLGIDNGKWRVYLWGKNLLDEFYVTRIFDTPSGGTGYSHYLSPNSERRFGITVQFGL
jgi:iron complex outermembrane receptor protein